MDALDFLEKATGMFVQPLEARTRAKNPNADILGHASIRLSILCVTL